MELLFALAGPFPGLAVACLVAILSFAASFWVVTRPGIVVRRPRTVVALVVWQVLLATFVDTDLSYIIALMLPFVYTRRRALVWLVGTSIAQLPYLAYFVFVVRSPGTSWASFAVEIGIHTMWQCFTFAIGLTAAIERDARAELARVNAQLVAAQELVADRTRLAERLAISRDLHDNLGHHLAALNIQLEVARHHATGPALEAIAQAQATGRQLLGELRAVVSTWRDDAVDLRSALRDLASAIDTPAISIEVGDELAFEPAVARTLYRCAQELVTNSVRHAAAGHVWISISAHDGGLLLRATGERSAGPRGAREGAPRACRGSREPR